MRSPSAVFTWTAKVSFTQRRLFFDRTVSFVPNSAPATAAPVEGFISHRTQQAGEVAKGGTNPCYRIPGTGEGTCPPIDTSSSLSPSLFGRSTEAAEQECTSLMPEKRSQRSTLALLSKKSPHKLQNLQDPDPTQTQPGATIRISRLRVPKSAGKRKRNCCKHELVIRTVTGVRDNVEQVSTQAGLGRSWWPRTSLLLP